MGHCGQLWAVVDECGPLWTSVDCRGGHVVGTCSTLMGACETLWGFVVPCGGV